MTGRRRTEIEALTLTQDEIREKLESNHKTRQPYLTVNNFLTVMRFDSRFADVKYNELAQRAEIHTTVNGMPTIKYWSDAEEASCREYIETTYGFYSKAKSDDALRIFLQERNYNPVKDIIEDVEWDGTERCEHFLHEWAKVDDSPYSREVSRLIFAGGIARLYMPGIKFDDVPVLIGTKQGEGKSTLIKWLALNDTFYGEVNIMEGTQAIEQLQGKWICEISELLALTKTKEQEAAKAYITRQVDTYRKPWDKNVSDLPRRCIMIGSTNRDDFLTDKSGNRRWYPVEVHSNGYELHDHEDECREYILQCWAEARDKFKAGKMPNYADRSLVSEYRRAQSEAMQDDWREGAILEFLATKMPGDLTCVREICHKALSPNKDFPKDPSFSESKDIGMFMNKQEDWESVGRKRLEDYGQQRAWRKKDNATYSQEELPF